MIKKFLCFPPSQLLNGRLDAHPQQLLRHVRQLDRPRYGHLHGAQSDDPERRRYGAIMRIASRFALLLMLRRRDVWPPTGTTPPPSSTPDDLTATARGGHSAAVGPQSGTASRSWPVVVPLWPTSTGNCLRWRRGRWRILPPSTAPGATVSTRTGWAAGCGDGRGRTTARLRIRRSGRDGHRCCCPPVADCGIEQHVVVIVPRTQQCQSSEFYGGRFGVRGDSGSGDQLRRVGKLS